MTILVNTIASPEVIPSKTVDKCRVVSFDVNCGAGTCSFVFERGYIDNGNFVIVSRGSGIIQNESGGPQDFDDYICGLADNTKTVCQNIEVGVWNYLVAKSLV